MLTLSPDATSVRADTNLRLSVSVADIWAAADASAEDTSHGTLLSVGGGLISLAREVGSVPDSAIVTGGLTLSFTLHCDEFLLPADHAAPYGLAAGYGSVGATVAQAQVANSLPGSAAGGVVDVASSFFWRSVLRLITAIPAATGNVGEEQPAQHSQQQRGESPFGWNQYVAPRLQNAQDISVRIEHLPEAAARTASNVDAPAAPAARGLRRLAATGAAAAAAAAVPAASVYQAFGRSRGVAGVHRITVSLPPMPSYAPSGDEQLSFAVPREFTASGVDVYASAAVTIRASNRPCVVSDFSSWSDCEPADGSFIAFDGGIRRRTRAMLQEPSGAGAACPELEQTQRCALPAANAASQILHTGSGSGLVAASTAGAGAGSHSAGLATGPAASRPATADASIFAGIAGACLVSLAVAGVAVSGVMRRLRGSSTSSRQEFAALPQGEEDGEDTASTALAPAGAAAAGRGRRVAGTAAAACGLLLVVAALLLLLPAADAAGFPASGGGRLKRRRPTWFQQENRVFSNMASATLHHPAPDLPAAAARRRELAAEAAQRARAGAGDGTDEFGHWRSATAAGASSGARRLGASAERDGDGDGYGSRFGARPKSHYAPPAPHGRPLPAERLHAHVDALNARIRGLHAKKQRADAEAAGGAHHDGNDGGGGAAHGDSGARRAADDASGGGFGGEDRRAHFERGADAEDDDAVVDISPGGGHVPLHVLPDSYSYRASISADAMMLDGGIGGDAHPLVLRLVCPPLHSTDGGRMEVHTVLHSLHALPRHAQAAPAGGAAAAGHGAGGSDSAVVADEDEEGLHADLGPMFVHPAHWTDGHILAGDHRWACKHDKDGMLAPFYREITAIRRSRTYLEPLSLPPHLDAAAAFGAPAAPRHPIPVPALGPSLRVTVWEVDFEEVTQLHVLEHLDMHTSMVPPSLRAHESGAHGVPPAGAADQGSGTGNNGQFRGAAGGGRDSGSGHVAAGSAAGGGDEPSMAVDRTDAGGGSDAAAAGDMAPALSDGPAGRRLIRIRWGFSGGWDKTWRWAPKDGRLVKGKFFNITCDACFAQLQLGIHWEARFSNFSPDLLEGKVIIAPSARFALMLAASYHYEWSRTWNVLSPITLFTLVLPAGPIPVPIPISFRIDAVMTLVANARIFISNIGFAAGYTLVLGARYDPDNGFKTYTQSTPSLEVFKPSFDIYGDVSVKVGPYFIITASPFYVWDLEFGVGPYGKLYATTAGTICGPNFIQLGVKWGVEAYVKINQPAIRIKIGACGEQRVGRIAAEGAALPRPWVMPCQYTVPSCALAWYSPHVGRLCPVRPPSQLRVRASDI
jgi:hypothetical protein